MARLDDLVGRVTDAPLRRELEQALAEVKRRQRFGLVFEQHLPEVTALPGLPVLPESLVQRRNGNGRDLYQVQALTTDNQATIVPLDNGTAEQVQVPIAQLTPVKRFGEPIYPSLTPLGSTRVGPADKPHHAVINAENYHALQMLLYLYEGQVDCIYIDPPYNTGAKDWKYNNRYVDQNDCWRHSKWLSMMEKRLRLAKRLLKRDSVMVVTIDEHEVHHLGMLLEKVLPEARRQMVTIVTNAAGVTQGGFSRVEEYAFFCFFGDARPAPMTDDLLADEGKGAAPIWFSMIRYGGVDGAPSKRPGMVYPIGIDPARCRIVGTGRTLRERVDAGEVTGNLDNWRPDPAETVNGYPVVWPYRGDQTLGRWQQNPEGLSNLLEEGFVRVRPQRNGSGGNRWSISYVKSGNQRKVRNGEIKTTGREPDGGALILGLAERNAVAKTVWRRTSHDAGKWGSRTLRDLLGGVVFDYAKSPYAVLDTLRACVGDRTDALIVDFFAGSGTTLHATCLLNAEDDGSRRCVLVTNNEVMDVTAAQLQAQGHFRGDPEYEAQGIFERVTRPRCEAVITGLHPDGTRIEGAHPNERHYGEGFPENVTFFKLEYLDPNEVDLGRRFDAIVPALWLTAGGVGTWEFRTEGTPFSIPPGATYGILFQESYFREFQATLEARPEVTHVWLVTDSEHAYAEMRAALPRHLSIGMLYRDYLRSFRINTERNL